MFTDIFIKCLTFAGYINIYFYIHIYSFRSGDNFGNAQKNRNRSPDFMQICHCMPDRLFISEQCTAYRFNAVKFELYGLDSLRRVCLQGKMQMRSGSIAGIA